VGVLGQSNKPEPEPPPNTVRAIQHLAYQLSHAATATPTQVVSLDCTPINDALVNRRAENCTTPSSTQSLKKQHELLPPKTTRNQTTMIRLISSAQAHTPYINQNLRLHIDGGANRSITNDHSILLAFRYIKTYKMSSAGGENDISCTGKGYLPWKAPNGDTLLVQCYYSPQAPETIVSPTDIVVTNNNQYKTWTQHADLSTNTGYIEFSNPSTELLTIFPLTNKNGLWYYSTPYYQDI
jgi:hypothetical protein